MTRVVVVLLLCCSSLVLVSALQVPETITIRAARLIDGRGHEQRNVVVTVSGGRIARVGSQSDSVTHELAAVTLMPGFIDTHVHILWHFGKDGRFDNRGETNDDRIAAGVVNARETVEHGFTTVQSVGEALDLQLRDTLQKGNLPGPRILTSVRQINERTGVPRGSRDQLATPDQLRTAVREAKAAGADVIKIFASASIRDGGKQT